MAQDRLSELCGSNALLAGALEELRTTRISNATADALVGVRVSDSVFSEFLALAARDLPQSSMFGFTLSLPEYIDRRHAGHDAFDYCLAHGGLTEQQIFSVTLRMKEVTRPDAVEWFHHRHTAVLKGDNEYYHFLARHLAVIVERCHDEMVAYLLSPNRGPAPTNVDSFDLAVGVVDDPAPFFRRWREWIWDGLFDPCDRPGASYAGCHYQILSQHWHEPAYLELRETTHAYVAELLRSPDREKRELGAHHLAAMVVHRYLGADHVVHRLLARIKDLPPDETSRLNLLRSALAAVARSVAAPTDQRLKHEADKFRPEVMAVSRGL
jgi:hypothetical protein